MVFCQGVQYMFVVVYFVVVVGKCCCQYYEVDNFCCCGNIDFGKCQYEWVVVGVDLILWEDSDDNKNCVDVENQDLLQYFVYCVVQCYLWVFCFICGNVDEFYFLIGCDYDIQCCQEVFLVVGKEIIMFGEIIKIDGVVVVVKVEENDVQIYDDYYDNGGYFYYGELEFDFIVQLDCCEVS